MENIELSFLASYLASLLIGGAVASGVRKGIATILTLLGKPEYMDRIVAGLTWVLILTYLWIIIFRHPPVTEVAEGEQGILWPVALSIAVCVLGLPLLIPALIRNIAKVLESGAAQWVVSVFIAIMTYVTFTIAQGVADMLIRVMLQTNPEQFPGAQRALTAWYAVFCWLTVLYLGAILSPFVARVIRVPTAGVFAGIFALYVVVPYGAFVLVTVGSANEQARRPGLEDIQELLILGSSFTPNFLVMQVVPDDSGYAEQHGKRVCLNLPDEVWVSPASPDEVIPDKVVVAEWRERAQGDRGPRYRYRLTTCENSNNPDTMK
jgi:hypothetical protein